MATGLKFYNHKQISAASTWIIIHNLGHAPVVDVVVDHEGTRQKVLPLNIEHTNNNRTTVTFADPQSGGARLY